MSTTPPPEQPTRRLDPTAPPPPPAYERVVEPGVPVAADASMLIVRLEDAISSLRTALIFVGLLAVLATGLSIYALTRESDTSASTTANAASDTRVARLEDRVDRISRQVQSLRASVRTDNGLSQRVDDLAKTVATLRSQSGDGAASSDVTQAIADLDGRLDRIEQQVQSLDQGATTP
jgi:hypothetical protein